MSGSDPTASRLRKPRGPLSRRKGQPAPHPPPGGRVAQKNARLSHDLSRECHETEPILRARSRTALRGRADRQERGRSRLEAVGEPDGPEPLVPSRGSTDRWNNRRSRRVGDRAVPLPPPVPLGGSTDRRNAGGAPGVAPWTTLDEGSWLPWRGQPRAPGRQAQAVRNTHSRSPTCRGACQLRTHAPRAHGTAACAQRKRCARRDRPEPSGAVAPSRPAARLGARQPVSASANRLGRNASSGTGRSDRPDAMRSATIRAVAGARWIPFVPCPVAT